MIVAKKELYQKIIKKGYSIKSFSEYTNISIPAMTRICKRQSKPYPKNAKKICKALECEFDDIFTIE